MEMVEKTEGHYLLTTSYSFWQGAIGYEVSWELTGLEREGRKRKSGKGWKNLSSLSHTTSEYSYY